MKTSLRKQLHRQMIVVILATYALCLGVLALNSFWQSLRTQDELLEGLIASSDSQKNLILPSFLLPEQYQGLPLLIEKMRREETLKSLVIISDENPPKEWADRCFRDRGIWICRRLFPNEIAALIPISHDGRFYGSMFKVKDVPSGILAPRYTSTALFLAFALLFSLVGLVWSTMRLTSKEIPSAVEALLTNVKRALAGEVNIQTESIRFEEYQRLSEAIQTMIKDVEEGRRASAIASVSQMLAHDVRKPFSLLRIAIGMLSKAENMDQVRNILTKLTPEIDKAVTSVTGLISDVMEAGSATANLILEARAPESLIETTLRDISPIHPQKDVIISYDLQHRSRIRIDPIKMERAFSNIIGNALQAMNYRGNLWFRTREVDQMIEFTIGNSGSFIPEEYRRKVFDAFFTREKKGGTGLGLAIAHKMVTAHGGKIFCHAEMSENYPDGMVEFTLTLPIVPH